MSTGQFPPTQEEAAIGHRPKVEWRREQTTQRTLPASRQLPQVVMIQRASFKGLPQTVSPLPFPTSFFSLPIFTWWERAQSFISKWEEEEKHQSKRRETGHQASSQPQLGREKMAAK